MARPKISPLDPGPFKQTDPITEGCHAAWATSFMLGSRVFYMTFEANRSDGTDYKPFCDEQGLSCEEIVVVKFDNEHNVEPKEMFKRMPIAYRMRTHEMLQLQRYLAGGIDRFLAEFNPNALVGVPNDAKLGRWYTRLSSRFEPLGRLIEMKESAYHEHRVLVIQKVF
jgi:hypothetical protein